jgi:redox-sensing transcriptional repressor
MPAASRERLLHLLKYLETKPCDGEGPAAPVSSAAIAGFTGWPRDTVRKDIALLEGVEGSAVGYDRVQLAEAISKALGLEREVRLCIVGLGRLGSAFLNYGGYGAYHLVAGFDSNVNRVEILKSPVPLYPAYKMGEVIQRQKIGAALLCVPAGAAQAVAEKLVQAGIRGLINFSPAALEVPPSVPVRNIDLKDELRELLAVMPFDKTDSPSVNHA